MKLTVLIFLLIAYNLVHAMIVDEANATSTFPTLTTPPFTPAAVPSGCSGFFDCTEYVGKVIAVFVVGVAYLIVLIFNLVVFVGAILIYITANSFQGIEGAPTWLNALLNGVVVVAIGLIIYKMIRKGDASDD